VAIREYEHGGCAVERGANPKCRQHQPQRIWTIDGPPPLEGGHVVSPESM
jgi:hypothetical protein